MRSITLLACLLAIVGCGKPGEVTVTNVWVHLPAVVGRPGAGYFVMRGGATDQTLVAVSTPASDHVEMHETTKHGPGTTMRPIDRVLIPAGATVTFAPGGKHLMLLDVAHAAVTKPFPITFTFADGHKLTVDTRAIAAGDPAP